MAYINLGGFTFPSIFLIHFQMTIVHLQAGRVRLHLLRVLSPFIFWQIESFPYHLDHSYLQMDSSHVKIDRHMELNFSHLDVDYSHLDLLESLSRWLEFVLGSIFSINSPSSGGQSPFSGGYSPSPGGQCSSSGGQSPLPVDQSQSSDSQR